MDSPSTTLLGETPPRAAESQRAAPQPFLWTVRREIWENRSVYVAPLAVAAVVLIGFLISLVYVPPGTLVKGVPDALRESSDITVRHDAAAIALLLTAQLVSLFYCLDALYGERRDRSILFWKSLPVSDATTVLGKLAVPMIVVPAVTFVVVMALQLVMMAIGSAVMLSHGMDGTAVWTRAPFFQGTLVLIYGLVTLAIWTAPVYAWAMLVSGVARRAPLLWAVFPPVALCIIERLGFGTTVLWDILKRRLTGGFDVAFSAERRPDMMTFIPHIEIGRFVSHPGVWAGIAVAAVLIYAAVRVRRSAEPI
jgi:ABC-2 type transport system permease protein